MSAYEIILKAKEQGIFLYLKGDSLAYKSASMKISEDLKLEFSKHKDEIISFLKSISVPEKMTLPIANSGKSKEKLPLSFPQRRLWVVDQTYPGEVHYNISIVFHMRDGVREDVLRAAMQSIIERHGVLRTVYRLDESGECIQVVRDDWQFEFIRFDVTSIIDESEREREINRHIQSVAAMPFNLSDDLMIKAGLITVSDDYSVLVAVLHHISSDGVSIAVFIGELGRLYYAYSRGLENPLPELKIQYSDYACWQHELWLNGGFSEGLRFLKDRLTGIPACHGLPLDKTRPSVPTYRGDIVRRGIDGQLLKQLVALAKQNEATLFMVINAAFAGLLYRYSGATDIVLGTPVANREQTDLTALIGYFANTLILRTDFSGNPTFKDLIKQSRDWVLEVYARQDVPFEKLLDELQPERSLNYSPLFQIMLAYRNSGMLFHDEGGLNWSGHEYKNGTVKFDLLLEVEESADSLHLEWEYAVDLFERESIERMATGFERLLTEIARQPESRIDDFSLLDKNAYDDLVLAWNATSRSYPSLLCIHELVEAQVRKTPQAEALVYEGSRLSYEQLNRYSNQVGHWLLERGVGPDVLVGLCLERSVEMVVGLLGILKAGGAYVPLDPEYPDERLRYLVGDGQIKLVLTARCFASRLEGLGCELLSLDAVQAREELASYSEEDIAPAALGLDPGHLAYVIYTSGSTGQPKGVMIEHRALVNRIDWMQREYGLDGNDRVLQKTPYTFDVSVWEFIWPLLGGATLVLARPQGHKDADYLVELIQGESITTLHFVPSMLNAVLAGGRWGECQSVRRVFCSGEALSRETQARFLASGTASELHNLYGPTEAAIDVSYWRCDPAWEGPRVPIGRPIQNIRLYVLDEQRRPVPVGVAGELYIGGVGLARGYLNRPGLTEAAFVADPFSDDAQARLYKTGDRVRYLGSGELDYLGRLDHQVKLRGYRIELGEIEHQLRAHAGVDDAAVLVREEGGHAHLVAYLVGGLTGQSGWREQLRGHLEARLPQYMVPTHYLSLAALPLTANGKLDRRALPSPSETDVQRQRYEAPGNELEAQVAALWARELGLERVGVSENYFQLGGDSIRALRLIFRMNAALRSNIRIKDLFLRPTIRGLLGSAQLGGGAEVEQHKAAGHARIEALRQAIVTSPGARHLPADWEDIYPLSAIQQGMVFFSQVRPDEPIYHDQFPYLLELPGFDLERLRVALDYLGARHPILRTTFDTTHFSEAVQIVHRQPLARVRYRDLGALSHDEQNQLINAHCQDDLQDKFRFSGEPLLRINLFGLGQDRYALVYSFQHAILDGWSMAVLQRELLQVYGQLCRGEAPSLAPLGSSYKDYVAVTLGRRLSETTAGYWKQALAGVGRTPLPFNHNGKPRFAARGNAIRRGHLDGACLRQLEQAAQRHGVTLKELCLAAHLVLVGYLSGEQDILTGVVTHDRPVLEDSENILGCFLNTLPLRHTLGSFRKTLSISALLKQTQEALRQIQSHELFLSEIAALVGESSPQGNPFFDTLFNYTDFAGRQVAGEAVAPGEAHLQWSRDIHNAEMTNTLFDLEVHRLGDAGLYLQLKYAPGYFAPSEMATALSWYERLLRALAQPGDSLSLNALMSQAERRALLVDLNNTAVAYASEQTLHGLFESRAEQQPDAVAVVAGGQRLSYGELNGRANRIAHGLLEQGLQPGEAVGLLAGRHVDLVAGLLGILKAGGTYIPLEPDYPLARKQQIIEKASLRWLLGDQPAGLELGGTTLLLEQALSHPRGDNPNLAVDSRQLAYVIYTSGSTGEPKGVMIAHHAAVNLIEWVNRSYAVGATDRLLCVTSVCFDLSVYDIFGTLAAGGQLVLAQAEQLRDPLALHRLLQEEKITLWDSVPSTLHHLVSHLEQQSGPPPLDELRLILLSGDWIPVSLPGRVGPHFPRARVQSLGGATEGTVWSNVYPIEQDMSGYPSIPYGKPIANNRYYVLDEYRQPVPWGVPGELYIGGVGVAEGYLNDAPRTGQAFHADPWQPPAGRMYKTGDRGRWLDDGNLEFLGRLDSQVKLRGYRVELGEIETVLASHPAVDQAVARVFEQARGTGEQQLVGYVTGVAGADQAQLNAEALKRHVQGRLPQYMVPAAIVVLDTLPLNANGKIDRKALMPPDMPRQTEMGYVSPVTDNEKTLAKIWSEVLNVPEQDIGRYHGFFDLGGHSLSVIRVIAKVREQLQVELAVSKIFESPVLENIASEISELISQKDIAAQLVEQLLFDESHGEELEESGSL